MNNFCRSRGRPRTAKRTQGIVDSALTIVMMVCVVLVLVEAALAWRRAPERRAARARLAAQEAA
jgi:hypothetical protein